MFSAMSRFLGLIGAAALWVGVLWFVIRLDFSRHSLLSVISIHLFPPLLAWGGWLFWRRHVRVAKMNADAAEKAREAAEHTAQRETALQAFQEQMQTRRYAIDCRWASVVSDGLADALPNTVGLIAIPRVDEVLTGFENRATAVVATVLSKLLAECPAVQYLPVYVRASPAFDLAQAVAAVRTLRDASGSAPEVSGLAREDEIAATIFARFEREPDLPGALFLTVDGPFNGDEQDEGDFSIAKPKHVDAVVVMLFTHPDLAAAYSKLTMEVGEATSAYDPMTPFWERKRGLQTGLVERLSQLPAGVPATLLELPIVAQLRRPVEVSGPKLDRAWSGALAQSLINANLKQQAFVWDMASPAEVPPQESDAESEMQCAWLVHNAGSFESTGDRLAVLGKALDTHGIDLNIIRQGTNVLADVTLGALDQWVSVAFALARAQQLEASTLWATFGTRSAVGMITPPQESNSTGNRTINA